MTDQQPHQIEQHVAVEILGMCPRIREDLNISVQSYGGEICYVIEDVLCSKFFRLGVAEYTFVSLLDGRTTVAQAMGQTAVTCGSDALDEREVATLCKWLLDSALATTDQASTESRLDEGRAKQRTRQLIGNANPMIQKIPLINPTAFLRRFDPVAKLLFGWLGFLLWTVVVVAAGVAVCGSWNDLTATTYQVLAKDNWIWLLVAWLLLKTIHEISHALSCRRFGGHVRQAGVVLILFAPMPYVDVTSAWRLDSKWKRIFISAAGMYAEIFCAAVAALVWVFSMDPLVRQHSMNVMLTATVMTLVFNANPLMRFDGYYILTDWIERPNLSTHSRQWLAYASRRYLMGMNVQRPKISEGVYLAVIVYALASMVWRVVVSVSLAVSAEVFFHGAGVAIAIIAIGVWVCVPIVKTVRTVANDSAVNRRRVFGVIATAGIAAWMCWSVVPWYTRSTVPLVIDYHPAHEVRVAVDGWLDATLVSSGDTVSRGQVLARLSNRELEIERDNLALELQKSEARDRAYLSDGAIAAAKVEQKRQATIQSKLNQIRKELEGLVVCAPIDGVIVTDDSRSLKGTVIHRGDRVFSIGDHDAEKMIGLVDQADVEAFRSVTGETLEVRIWGMGPHSIAGTVRRVLPRASQTLPYPSLGAPNGGPLSVRRQHHQQLGADGLGNGRDDEMVLVDPRFTVLIDFAGIENENVMPGQTGYARLNYRNGTFGQAVWDSVGRWIQDKRETWHADG